MSDTRAADARSRWEVVVPLRASAGRVAPVTHLRSTLLASSIQTLKARGLLSQYLEKLPRELHPTVLEAVAGGWMPIAIGAAHYAAADALALSQDAIFDNGRAVADRVQNTMLGTLVRAAKSVGVTPWIGLEQFQRLWDRLLLGGSGAVYRTGAKEARVESHGNPLVRWSYFRHSWRGMFAASGELFCDRFYVTEVSVPAFDSTAPFVMRVAWS
ncbi:MAG: hypothetical protein M3O50_10660 [Myxococcota bacterium]|nr:hypothetical protein [Myxococcota bacterium]